MSGASAAEPLFLDLRGQEEGEKTAVNRSRDHRLEEKNYYKPSAGLLHSAGVFLGFF